MQIGIESLAFATSKYALDLAQLAQARQQDPVTFGKGFQQISVAPPDEDIVTLAVSAAQQALASVEKKQIDWVLFATESAVDQSKAAGIYVHQLLDLPRFCRVIELKQACYSGTAALQLALAYLMQHSEKKVLLIASDIARYPLLTPGEASQGCAAVALVLSAQPRLLTFEPWQSFITLNSQDFWRPNYLDVALVDGRASSRLYLNLLLECWQQFSQQTGLTLAQITQICYHTPVPRLVEKAQRKLLQMAQLPSVVKSNSHTLLAETLAYSRYLGNSYTATLMISLASLLDHANDDLSGQRIGFYSYGSGSVAEFFTGCVLPNYQTHLATSFHKQQINQRKLLNVAQYETFYHAKRYNLEGNLAIADYQTTPFRFAGLKNHQRQYISVNA